MRQIPAWLGNKIGGGLDQLREDSHSSVKSVEILTPENGIKISQASSSATSLAQSEENSLAQNQDSYTTVRDALKEWHALARRTLSAVAMFSIFVNLLMLTIPLYLFQLSDRVLT